MADVVPITAGSGTNISTDERTIATVAQHVQRVGEIGGSAIATDQVDVTTTSAEKVAARETRKYVTIVNHGSAPFWVGASGVSITTGLKVPAGGSITLYTTAAIHADAESTLTDAFHYLEVYDS